MKKGYYTEDKRFYEYDDARNLKVGKYTDISYESTSGYWIDDNGHMDNIISSTYDALKMEGATESDEVKYTFKNEYNGMSIHFDDASVIVLYKYIDIDGGGEIGYKAEFDSEFDISSATYDALVGAGAEESEKEILAFQDYYGNCVIPADDARQIYIRKVYDVDTGRAGKYVAECSYGEFAVSESTAKALMGAGASGDDED